MSALRPIHPTQEQIESAVQEIRSYIVEASPLHFAREATMSERVVLALADQESRLRTQVSRLTELRDALLKSLESMGGIPMTDRLAAALDESRTVIVWREALTDAELDAIYPESHNLGTYHQEIHRTLLRKVIVAATGKQSLPVAEPAHPWGVFLAARADVLDWLHEDGHADEQIAQSLCMDAVQVRMIRSRDRSGDVLPGYRSTPIKPSADVVVVSRDEWEAAEMVLRAWNGGWREDKMISPFFAWNEIRSSTLRIIAVGSSNGGSTHA